MRERDATCLKRSTSSNIISLTVKNEYQAASSSGKNKDIPIKPYKLCIVSIIISQCTFCILFFFVDLYNNSSIEQYTTILANENSIYGIPTNIFTTGINESIHHANCKHLFNHWSYNHFDAQRTDHFIETFFKSSFNDSHSFLSNLTTYGVERADLWRYAIINTYGGMYMDTDIECEIPFNEWYHNLRYTYTSSHVFNQSKISHFPYNKQSVHQIPAPDFDPMTDIDMIIGVEYWFPVVNVMQFVQWIFLSKPNNPILNHVISSVIHAVSNIPVHVNNIQRRTGPHIWSSSILEFMSMHASDLSGVRDLLLKGCKYRYDGPKYGYLKHCDTEHCAKYSNLKRAQYECNKDVRCIGVTELNGVYELRSKLPLIQDTKQRFRSWIKTMDSNTTEYCRRKTHYVLPNVLLEPRHINENGQLISLYYKKQRLYLLILPHFSFGFMDGWDGNQWSEEIQKRRFVKHLFASSWKIHKASPCIKMWKLQQLQEENKNLKQKLVDMSRRQKV